MGNIQIGKRQSLLQHIYLYEYTEKVLCICERIEGVERVFVKAF